MEEIRTYIKEFISVLTSYDYMSFSVTFLLFALFLILALLIRHRIKLSTFLVILAFFSLFIGPVIMHSLVKATLFKHDANVTMVKKLVYSDTLVVKGNIYYTGKNEAHYCDIYVDVYKKDENFFKNLANSLKSYKSTSTRVVYPFIKGDVRPFKVVIEPFNYLGDYEVKLDTDCLQ